MGTVEVPWAVYFTLCVLAGWGLADILYAALRGRWG